MSIKPKNYIIDGDVDGIAENDFFNQLKNMNKTNDTSNNNEGVIDADADSCCCLLTKEPLDNIHIKLTCGHKFNYVPLYREVVMQKTTGMSSTGYYTTHSLKRNEIKCPYCRTVQDKLLPFLEYDGVSKTVGVNYPNKLSMSVQACNHTCHDNNKKKKSSCCKENATQIINGVYLCKKHSYHVDNDTSIYNTSDAEILETIHQDVPPDTCGVILKYGKNKGNPCKNSSKCRIHLNKLK